MSANLAKCLFLALLAGVLRPAGAGHAPADADQCASAGEGRGFYLLGEYQAALEVFRDSSDAPGDRRAHEYLVRCQLALGRYAEALQECRRAIALAPGAAELYDLLGVIHVTAAFARADPAEAEPAIGAFRQALALDPSRAISHYNLGVAYAYRDSMRLAEQAYAAAVGVDSSLAPAHKKLGLIYHRQGHPVAAAASLRRAVANLPDDGEALLLLGLVCRSAGDPRAALEALQRAAALDPGLPPVHLHLGQVYLRLGLPEQGRHELRVFDKLRQKRSNGLAEQLQRPMGGTCRSVASVLYDTAMGCAQRGETERALDELRRAVEINPDLLQAYGELGLLLARRGALTQAARWFRQAAALAPDDPAAHARLGLVCLRLNRAAAAEQELTAAAGLDEAMAATAKALASTDVWTGTAAGQH